MRRPAEDVVRPDEDRIPDPLGHLERLLPRVGDAPARLPGCASSSRIVPELAPILGRVDRRQRVAEQRHARRGEPVGEPQRRLAAERHDDAQRLLDRADVERPLERDRLEVEAVGGVVVGRHRLRVRVEQHRLVAQRGGTPALRARSSSRTRSPARSGSGPEPRTTIVRPGRGLGLAVGSPSS